RWHMAICAIGMKIGGRASARNAIGADSMRAVATASVASCSVDGKVAIADATIGNARRGTSAAARTNIIAAGVTGRWRRWTAIMPTIAASVRKNSTATSTAGGASGAAIPSPYARE